MLRLSVFLLAALTAGGAIIDARYSGQNRRAWSRIHPQVADAGLDGSLPALLRGRLLATRALVVAPRAGDLLADAAFVEALLAHDFGLPSERAAEDALARASSEQAVPAAPPAAVLSTRALLALVRGDPALGLELSRAAAEMERQDPRPLMVLGRAQLAAGDLTAAAAVFQAASARAPGMAAALIGWAEAQLGLGQKEDAVAGALDEALRRGPGDTRALLLREQIQLARDGAFPSELERRRQAACQRDRVRSPSIAGKCDLQLALLARLRGDRAAAREGAHKVVTTLAPAGARRAPPARELGLAAILLCHLGEVDAAERALGLLRAAMPENLMASHPMVAWAQVTIAGARGEPPPRALPPFPRHPETRLAAAREALAEGGPEGLTAFLRELGEEEGAGNKSKLWERSDPDLRSLARLSVGAEPPLPAPGEPPSQGSSNPVFAFVEGLRAAEAGDPPLAGRWLARALSGHADACRAAGRYLTALALAGRTPDNELEPLRQQNARCQELNWTEPEPAATEVASPSGTQ